MYTILREVGHVDNVRIGLVGDLANGRTARSLAYLLSMYKGIKMYFVAPDVVRMGVDIKDFLTSKVTSVQSSPAMQILTMSREVMHSGCDGRIKLMCWLCRILIIQHGGNSIGDRNQASHSTSAFTHTCSLKGPAACKRVLPFPVARPVAAQLKFVIQRPAQT